jgi:hypothetical protein
MGGFLESVMFHRPQKKDGLTTGWNGWQVAEMETGDLELVTEMVKLANIPLVLTYHSLGGPGVGGINHPHPFQLHESIHGAAC